MLFGGYGGLLNEKNDIWNFSLDDGIWNCVDGGLDFESHRASLDTIGKQARSKVATKNYFSYISDENDKLLNRSFSKFNKQQQQQSLKQLESGHNPFRNLKKKQFLQPFQMSHDEERDLLITTPVTKQLRQSIEYMQKEADALISN